MLYKLDSVSSVMSVQKVGTVLCNHTVPHNRLDWVELKSVPGISLTEAKSKGVRSKEKEERERGKEKKRKEEAMSVRESERFGIAAYYIVKDISLLA